MRAHRRARIAALCVAGVALAAAPVAAAAQDFGGEPSAGPWGMTSGPDGNLWFVREHSGRIARMTPAGRVTEVARVSSSAHPSSIVTGPDGAMWFTEPGTAKIGRVALTGGVTEYPLTRDSVPLDITAGPDGALWFTERGAGKIGRITTAGEITEFAASPAAFPEEITLGPDGNLWFTAVQQMAFPAGVGRITPAGQVTLFRTTQMSGEPKDVTTGPDGNVWATTTRGAVRVTPGGDMTGFHIGTGLMYVAAGSDGALWATDPEHDRLMRIGMDGRATPIGPGVMRVRRPMMRMATPLGITRGPDGRIWFSEHQSGRIGRVVDGGGIVEYPPLLQLLRVRSRGARAASVTVRCPVSAPSSCVAAIGLFSEELGTGGMRRVRVTPGHRRVVVLPLSAKMTRVLRAKRRVTVIVGIAPREPAGYGGVLIAPNQVLRLG